MFSYYGSKSKIVKHYPPPKYDKIIEPFAGSARYSLKYYDRDITIVDKYDVIVKIWNFLKQASKNDILSLPNLKTGDNLNDYKFDCEESKLLMGFIIKGGDSRSCLKVSPRRGESIQRLKLGIANNLHKIRHWNIILGDYKELENQEATWFIDPPYQYGGHKYPESNKYIDFQMLAKWCKSRNGQVIVCENTKADWLPFKPMIDIQGSMFKTTEAIWSNMKTPYDTIQGTLFGESNDNFN